MNLLELKEHVHRAINRAHECDENPAEIQVSIQVDDTDTIALWSEDITLTYDNNCQASYCVIHGWSAEKPKKKCPECDQNKDSGMTYCAFCGDYLK